MRSDAGGLHLHVAVSGQMVKTLCEGAARRPEQPHTNSSRAPAPANRHDPRHARYSAAYCAVSVRVHGPDFANLLHVRGTTTSIFV
jgi:hypothetical protein